MSYQGKHKRAPLAPCPECHMDSGVRKVTVKVPEKFFVVCESCGFKTEPHTSQSGATKEWNWRVEHNVLCKRRTNTR